MSQITRDLQPQSWVMFDRHRKVALIRVVEIAGLKGHVYRAVTWSEEPSQRKLIGYFPSLEWAATASWLEWAAQQPPPTSERR